MTIAFSSDIAGATLAALGDVRGEAVQHGVARDRRDFRPQQAAEGAEDHAAVEALIARVFGPGRHTKVSARVREFAAYAKAKPGKVSYASLGNGNVVYLGTRMLESFIGTEMVCQPAHASSWASKSASGPQRRAFSSALRLSSALR